MAPLIAAAAIVLLAMIVRGLTGFGAALIMTPLLLLVFNAKTAIVAAAIVQAFIGLTLVYQVRGQIAGDYLKLLLPPSILGIIVGSLALMQFDSGLLKRALGGIVMLFALRSLGALRGRVGSRSVWHRGWGYIAAGVSGLLGALFGTSGPPIVIYLENQITGGASLRATLIAYFTVVDCVRVAGYVAGNLVTADTLTISAAMAPTALLGSYIGARLHLNMPERAFRSVVAVLLLATGLLLVVT